MEMLLKQAGSDLKMTKNTPVFTENNALKGRESEYTRLDVNVRKVLESWKLSLFSFEWLHPDGRFKDIDELPVREHEKRLAVEQSIKNGQPLETPVLGIGMMDNVEIGAGKAVFLTLAVHGFETVPVFIPSAQKDEFEPYLSS